MIISHNIVISRIISGTWKHSVVTAVTCVVTYFANEFFIKHYFEMPGMIPPLLGTALAFFIGFSNNQAYDRWWEARIIWGAMVNESRTWARQLINYTSNQNNASKTVTVKMVRRHIAFLYVLKEVLRENKTQLYKKYLSAEEAEEINKYQNRQSALLDKQAADLNLLYSQGCVDGFQFIGLNQAITNFCNEMGKSERIKNTVFPTMYSYYTKSFIWIFIVSVTMVAHSTIGIWSILLGTLTGYVFLTIHSIGMLLVNPFESIATGIPLDQITRTIEINLLQMLKEQDIPEPVRPVNDEYIM